MPKIPDRHSLGSRPAPSARRQIVGIDGGQVARALEGAGDAMYRAGGHMQDAEDKTNYLTARLQFQRERALADKEFDENPDFEAAQTAYEARLNKAKEDAGSLIRGQDRKNFMLDADTDVARSTARVGGVVRARRKDARRASLFESLDGLRDAALTHPDNDGRNSLVSSGYLAIDGALEKGEITAVEAQEWKRKFATGIAEGYVSMLPDEEQVRVLSGSGKGNEAALIKRESSGDPKKVNQFGYAGLYQFGAPRLADLGVYKPGDKENLAEWSKSAKDAPGKWSGTFDIPGHPEVKTLEQFRASPEAQKAAFDLHAAKMDAEIEEAGLSAYEGKTVKGVRITRDGLRNMLHLGGVGGAKAALEGRGDPKDANGTSVMDYARMGAGETQVASADPKAPIPANDAAPGPRSGIGMIDPVKRQAMLEAAQLRLQRKAEAGRVEREAQQTQAITDDLITRYGTSPDGEAKALAYLRTKYAGKAENDLVSAYTGRAAEARRLEAARTDGLFDATVRKVWDGKAGDITPEERAELERKGQWDKVGVEIEAQQAGNAKSTDYLWLYENYKSLPPSERMKVPLATIKANTSRDDYEKIYKDRKELVEDDPAERSAAELITQRMKELGLKADKKDDALKIDAFHNAYEAEVAATQKKEGRKATNQERREIVNRLTGKIAIERPGWLSRDVDAPAYELTLPGDKNAARISRDTGVPVDQVPDVIRALERRGLPLTMDSIKKAWEDGTE